MKKLKVTKMKFELKNDIMYCREIYENGESFLILLEESPTRFIKKIARLKDGISQEELNKSLDKAFGDEEY